jgi:hypothetical protein
MSVVLLASCGGCEAAVRVGVLRREFVPVATASGFGWWQTVLPEPPEGWLLFDPYTQCCYCPVCAEELLGPCVNQDAAAEVPESFDHYALVAAA